MSAGVTSSERGSIPFSLLSSDACSVPSGLPTDYQPFSHVFWRLNDVDILRCTVNTHDPCYNVKSVRSGLGDSELTVSKRSKVEYPTNGYKMTY